MWRGSQELARNQVVMAVHRLHPQPPRSRQAPPTPS